MLNNNIKKQLAITPKVFDQIQTFFHRNAQRNKKGVRGTLDVRRKYITTVEPRSIKRRSMKRSYFIKRSLGKVQKIL